MTLKTKLRKFYFAFSRQRLKNKSFTLISNNCLAGCVLHDFSMRFDTPTINLFIPFPDYIKFLTDLKCYVNKTQKYLFLVETQIVKRNILLNQKMYLKTKPINLCVKTAVKPQK